MKRINQYRSTKASAVVITRRVKFRWWRQDAAAYWRKRFDPIRRFCLVDFSRRSWLIIHWRLLCGQSLQQQWQDAVLRAKPNKIEFCEESFFRLGRASILGWSRYFNP